MKLIRKAYLNYGVVSLCYYLYEDFSLSFCLSKQFPSVSQLVIKDNLKKLVKELKSQGYDFYLYGADISIRIDIFPASKKQVRKAHKVFLKAFKRLLQRLIILEQEAGLKDWLENYMEIEVKEVINEGKASPSER